MKETSMYFRNFVDFHWSHAFFATNLLLMVAEWVTRLECASIKESESAHT